MISSGIAKATMKNTKTNEGLTMADMANRLAKPKHRILKTFMSKEEFPTHLLGSQNYHFPLPIR